MGFFSSISSSASPGAGATARPIRQKQDDFNREAVPHLDALYGTALYLTRNPRDAEDLVQETFLKAFRAFDRYEPGTNCKAWLFRIMTNTHINRGRSRHRDFTLLETVDIAPASTPDVDPRSDDSAFYKDPEQGYLHGLVHESVREALEGLPPDFRAVVVLADLQEFAYKEIAEVLEIPIGTVMSRLHRGRKLLQKRLRNHAIAQGIISPDAESAEPEPVRPPTSLDAYRARRTSSAPGGRE